MDSALIDLSKNADQERIKAILQPDSTYNVYWNAVRDIKDIRKRIDHRYKDNI
jgi:hypothetical protein